MKTLFTILLRSVVAYFVFAAGVIILGMADLRWTGPVRFHNGEEPSGGKIAVFCIAQFAFVVATGYVAFKRARHDWKLWKKLQKNRTITR